ncbi:MAG: hypothetical protein ACHQK9_09300 [Reyranellales bacterium]
MNLVVARGYENFKRGTIHSLDPSTRGLVVVWEDLGRVKMKASDLVVKSANQGGSSAYGDLKPGQIVDIHWYDYVDFMVAKTTPEITAKAKAMVAQGAGAEGWPGKKPIRLFSMAGMVTKVNPDLETVSIINASGGEPDRPSPDSGEVIQLPQIRSPEGQAALKTLKPGDNITTVFSVQTALSVLIIR